MFRQRTQYSSPFKANSFTSIGGDVGEVDVAELVLKARHGDLNDGFDLLVALTIQGGRR